MILPSWKRSDESHCQIWNLVFPRMSCRSQGAPWRRLTATIWDGGSDCAGFALLGPCGIRLKIQDYVRPPAHNRESHNQLNFVFLGVQIKVTFLWTCWEAEGMLHWHRSVSLASFCYMLWHVMICYDNVPLCLEDSGRIVTCHFWL